MFVWFDPIGPSPAHAGKHQRRAGGPKHELQPICDRRLPPIAGDEQPDRRPHQQKAQRNGERAVQREADEPSTYTPAYAAFAAFLCHNRKIIARVLTIPIRESIVATPRAQIIRLDLQAEPFAYHAGQAAFLHPDRVAKRRPYSIASAPEQTLTTGLLEFLVQTDVDGLQGVPADVIQPGALVRLEGPIGSFQFPDHPPERHFLFIAGGTGIAPLHSMLWHALLAERGGRITLIYSVRSPEELAYLHEFEELAAAGRIDFHHTVTRAASEGWPGRQGRIDTAYLRPLIAPGDTLCFLCGPPALVGEIPALLQDLGVQPRQIVMEQWSS
jgi:NAD(P)H-flavin reductase